MAKIRTMTEGHPLKLIFAFSLPLMFGNVFQQFYTVVDTMVVGQALGVGALAALGAADWLNWMVLGMIQGISQGFAILMAYEFGAGDYRKLRQVIANSAILACLGSVVMLALMQAAARPVLLLTWGIRRNGRLRIPALLLVLAFVAAGSACEVWLNPYFLSMTG